MKQKKYIFVLLVLFSSFVRAEDIEAKMDWSGLQKMSFAVTGIVDSIFAKTGLKVSKGDVLAKLDIAPFNYQLEYCKAAIEKIEPVVFDAKIELDQAEELFERTVLSEFELQKIDGAYKALVAEQSMAEADCKLKAWNAKRSKLIATQPGYIQSLNIYPGMVISIENQSMIYVELTSATRASASAFMSAQQVQNYKVSDTLKVVVDGQEIVANIESISWQGNELNQFKVTAEFDYAKRVVPGKAVTLRF